MLDVTQGRAPAQGGASLSHPHASQQSVLIVDPSTENREVLRTVLSRRGIKTWEACDLAHAVELHLLEHPSVTVIDIESVEGSDSEDANNRSIEQLTATDTDPQNAFVFLGQTTRPSSQNVGRVLKKPYHFAPLIRTIEAMLQEHGTAMDAS